MKRLRTLMNQCDHLEYRGRFDELATSGGKGRPPRSSPFLFADGNRGVEPRSPNKTRIGLTFWMHPAIIYFAGLLLTVLAVPPAIAIEPPKWDLEKLLQAPAAVEAQQGKVPGLESLYLDGLPYRGRPTRFYAYFGMPKDIPSQVPAVVLVHGGGGTAFADWVNYWTAKGYAALALDTEGHVPVKVHQSKPGDSGWLTIDSLNLGWCGPPGRAWDPKTAAGYADGQLPPDEQWLYHAVADSILSVSWLAANPKVDKERIGIVGISMGSIVCSLVGGIDDRLAFVVPQYIGGNNDLGNVWYAGIQANPEVRKWDPANFYRQSTGRADWLWINGINDKYGLPPMTSQSYRETGPRSWMCLLPTQGHGHVWIEKGKNAVREIYAFADSVTKGTPPLTRILRTALSDSRVTIAWEAQVPVARAQLCYTQEFVPTIEIAGELRKDWEKVRYQIDELAVPTVIDLPDGAKQAVFSLPEGLKAGFVNLIDSRDLSISSEFFGG